MEYVPASNFDKPWQRVRFGELYAAPSRNGVYKAKGFHGRGCRIVNMGEMFGLDFISNQEMNRVFLSPAELEVNALIDGDLLFGRRSIVEAGAGKCSIIVNPSEPLTFESSIIRVRLKTGTVNPAFYYYFFRSPPGREIVRGIVSGTNVKGIRGTELKELSVPLPGLLEQNAIAAALSDVDALISSLDHLIAKKRDIKRATMQQLLTGKQRLPGFHGEWETKKLGELGSWKGGMTPSMRNPAFWSNGDIPWASSADIKEATIVDTQMRITEAAIKQSAATLLPATSILIVTRSGILRRYLPVAKNLRKMAINQDIKALIPSSGFHPDFLFHAISANGDRILSTCMKSGTTVESIEYAWLKAYQIGVPQVDEQVAIASVLSDMDAEISALEKRRDKTRELKQGMMQELLTGRIRLV